MQPQTVQRFRISYETEYVPEEVTSYRPVLKTRTETREYKVAKPIVETSYREETVHRMEASRRNILSRRDLHRNEVRHRDG